MGTLVNLRLRANPRISALGASPNPPACSPPHLLHVVAPHSFDLLINTLCNKYPNLLPYTSAMADTTHQVPEWEAPAPKNQNIFSKYTTTSKPAYKQEEVSGEASGEDTPAVKRTFSDRFLPHWAACMGRSRKSMLLSIAALILLVALILGLGLGLGLSHKSLVNLYSFHPGVLL